MDEKGSWQELWDGFNNGWTGLDQVIEQLNKVAQQNGTEDAFEFASKKAVKYVGEYVDHMRGYIKGKDGTDG